MTGPEPSRGVPGWLAPAVVLLLTGQLVLLYVQGAQLHRQHGELRDLRQDVQVLTEALDEALQYEEEGYRPSRGHRSGLRSARSLHRVILEEDPEPAAREVEASRQDAQKAVKQARETQEKLSIEANAEKARQAAAVEKEQRRWGPLIGLGFALALVVLVVRSFLRRGRS